MNVFIKARRCGITYWADILNKIPEKIRLKTKFPPVDRLHDDCWIYEGEKSSNGYGRVWYKEVRQSAHRVIYRLVVGTLDDKKQLDHTCCVRNCVNPAHLQPVTPKQNCKLREKRKNDNRKNK